MHSSPEKIGPDDLGGSRSSKVGRPRSDAARRSILEASLAILSKDGVSGLTIEGIAERAGVSKQTIYRWWPSAAHIVAEATIPFVRVHERNQDLGSLRAELDHVLRPLVRTMKDVTTPAIATMLKAALESAEFACVFKDQLMAPFWEVMADVIGRAIARGELARTMDRQVAADQIYGAILMRVVFHQDLTDARFLDALIGSWADPSPGSLRARSED